MCWGVDTMSWLLVDTLAHQVLDVAHHFDQALHIPILQLDLMAQIRCAVELVQRF